MKIFTPQDKLTPVNEKASKNNAINKKYLVRMRKNLP